MKPRRIAIIGVAVALMAVAGCSSSGSKSGNDSGHLSSGSTGGTTSTGSDSAGAGTGGTIDIGFASEFTGTNVFPAIKQAGIAAEKWVNANGGLAGKHLNLVTCDMKDSTQGAQECGQQFANDTQMPFAILPLTLDGGPFYAAMNAANKPVLGGLAITPADNSPKDSYFYYPGAYFSALAGAVKQEGWKSVSFIYQDNASITPGVGTFKSAMTGSGVDVKYTAFPTGTSDLTPAIASAGVTNSEGTVVIAPQICSQIASTMQSLNLKPKNVMTIDSCLNRSAVKANPSLYEGWIDTSNTKLGTSVSTSDPDVATFAKAWNQYGPGGVPGAWAELGWGTILTAQKVFANAKMITSASANTAIGSYKGPIVMGTPTISCPGTAPYTSSCASGLIFYKINNGQMYPTKI